MLATVRRGSTSVIRSFVAASSPIRCTLIASTRLSHRPFRSLAVTRFDRKLHSATQWKRNATASAEVEEEDFMEHGELAAEHLEAGDFAQAHDPQSHIGRGRQEGLVTKFQELADRNMVSPAVVKTLTQDMKLETMTEVQCLTINETLKGIDVLAQARTGTGKTLAFLIPILQSIIKRDPALEGRTSGYNRASATDIRAIIVSPTRELAEQIAVEAQKVVRNTRVIVQTAVGGSSKAFGLRKIKNEGCHILVGTPGRLNDILSDPYSNVRAPNLSAFVLDEADRLLDQGFAPEIESIQSLLPNRREVDRQTLLFSATVPEEVMHIVNSTMKPNYKFVRTVKKGEQQTHERVPQKIVQVAGFENMMPALLELCKQEIAQQDRKMPFKAIVYFNATTEVLLASAIFRNLRKPNASRFDQHPLWPTTIVEIHSRLTQERRTRSADDFRKSKSSIMFSSDVTARGMDFPNVTHVIQIGLPTSRDTYIHRVGRTARGDKTGEGWVFISPLEMREAQTRLNKLPLQPDQSLNTAQIDMTKDAQVPADVAQTLTQVVDATRLVPMLMKANAYLATFGCFSWFQRKQDLVDAMNQRSKYEWGLETPPSVAPGIAQKLGLRRVSGLNFGVREPRDFNDDGSRPSFGRDRGFPPSGNSRYGRDSTATRSREQPSGFTRDRGSSSAYSSRDRNAYSGSSDRNTSFGSHRGGTGSSRRSNDKSWTRGSRDS
ncbi:hypothetical protein MMC13_006147 [Lambiella insularis]|nr:hypothetical protein [Lambiella insularis]